MNAGKIILEMGFRDGHISHQQDFSQREMSEHILGLQGVTVIHQLTRNLIKQLNLKVLLTFNYIIKHWKLLAKILSNLTNKPMFESWRVFFSSFYRHKRPRQSLLCLPLVPTKCQPPTKFLSSQLQHLIEIQKSLIHHQIIL